jgi:hypothetical protein
MSVSARRIYVSLQPLCLACMAALLGLHCVLSSKRKILAPLQPCSLQHTDTDTDPGQPGVT